MQSAAKHAAPYGVRVNAILPGIIRTAMWEEILEGMNNGWDPEVHNELTPEKREELWNASVKSMIPLGHDQKEEDIAWATVFLASAVSYTHLDVYKRQDVTSALSNVTDDGSICKLAVIKPPSELTVSNAAEPVRTQIISLDDEACLLYTSY